MAHTASGLPHAAPVVLAAVDGSLNSYRATAGAADEAVLQGCGLQLINSWTLPVGSGPEVALTGSSIVIVPSREPWFARRTI
ncbi:hypothetical protein [Nocardia grenadensis]|uniref:hypothetical protein n=1 Tax=Nocardia grenadensis TaxID=931537 RepID=UPI0007A373DB|nr:hypothetical protein [Nocardia grenadensis]